MDTKSFGLLKIFSGKRDITKFLLVIEILVVCVIFQWLTKGLFLSNRNISNLLMQGVTCSLISITMMLVLVSRNSDLSAGAAIGFMGTLAAQMQVVNGIGSGRTILVVILVGVLLGLWHGYWIAYMKLPAFIVTLGTQLILRGLILIVGHGRSIGPASAWFSLIGRGTLPSLFVSDSFNDTSTILVCIVILGYLLFEIRARMRLIKEQIEVQKLPLFAAKLILVIFVIVLVSYRFLIGNGFSYAIILLCIFAGAFHYIVKNTPFGRHVFALGGNEEAARLSGINAERTVMSIYILHSLVTSMAAIVFLGRIGNATPTAGTGFEFTAITGCVIGGTSFRGGRGNVLGAVIGTMLMAGVDNGMSLLNLGAEYQFVVRGLVLIFAIAVDAMSQKK